MGSDEFIRHHMPLIFDVPADLVADRVRAVEILNLVSGRMIEVLENDPGFQNLLQRHGIEWGWEKATWEK